jgi:hypothetical protein
LSSAIPRKSAKGGGLPRFNLLQLNTSLFHQGNKRSMTTLFHGSNRLLAGKHLNFLQAKLSQRGRFAVNSGKHSRNQFLRDGT